MESRAKSVVRGLAEETVKNIEKDQGLLTASIRTLSLAQFKKVLADQSTSDEQLIGEARALILINKGSGKFGWRGEEKSTFLKHMSSFLVEAQDNLEWQKKQKEIDKTLEEIQGLRIIKTAYKTIKHAADPIVEQANQRAEKLQEINDQHLMKPIDAKRIKVEDKISKLMLKHHRSDHVKSHWNGYFREVRQNHVTPHYHENDKILFNNVHPDIKKAFAEYEKLLTPDYLDFYNRKHKQEALDNHAEKHGLRRK